MRKIQILLIEDNRLLREGIALVLRNQSDMHVVATVGNGKNILLMIEKHHPNIILIDLGLRNQNSLRIVKSVKQHFPDLKSIVMDLVPLQADVHEFFQAGVSGFIPKDSSIAEFVNTIRLVSQGVEVMPPNLTGSLFAQIVELAITASKPNALVE